jgi:peptide/nickel transport system substrate-binding protein
VLRVQVDHLPTQLNPLVSFDLWCQAVTLHTIFEPLVTLQASGVVQPHLASGIEVKAGGRVVVLTLRKGVLFHDGRPMTSTDVRFTLDRLIGRNAPSDLFKIELGDVDEVRAPDEHHVELSLRKPSSLLPAILAEIPILPAHVHGRFGLRNPKHNWMPIGTGPFQVVERKTRDLVLLARNERYWGQAPRLAQLQFVAISDPSRALAALRNNELDIISSLYPGYYPEQLAAGRVKDAFRVLRIHPYRMRILLYNTRHPALRDRRVRAALERLVDRDRIVRISRNKLGQVVSAPIWTLSSWYDGSIHAHSFDRAAALRLLEAAGWQDPKATGHRTRAGHPLRLRILRAKEAGEIAEAANVLKADFRGAGIDATVESADFGFLKLQLRRGKFDLALLGLAPRVGSDLSPLLHSRGALNYGAYSNPNLDAYLDAMRLAVLPDERRRIGQRLHRMLQDDPPFTVLYAPIELMVVARRVRGLANNGRPPRYSALWLDEVKGPAGRE